MADSVSPGVHPLPAVPPLAITLPPGPLPAPIVPPSPPPPPLIRLLAPRSIFFDIPLRDPAVESSKVAPVNPVTGPYLTAVDRVNNAPERDGNQFGLDPDQRSAIIAILTALNDYYPSHPLTVALTAEIASNTDDVMKLANYGNIVHRGLSAFECKYTPTSDYMSSTLYDLESTASQRTPHSAPVTAPLSRGSSARRRRPRSSVSPHTGRLSNRSLTSHSAASTPIPENDPGGDITITAFPFHRRGSAPAAVVEAPLPSSPRVTRSNAVRTSCKIRDSERCRICDGGQGISAHVIPFSLRDGKAVDFWKLVAMFRGEAETRQMKTYALEPDAENADNILNVVCMCRNCHHLYDHAAITLVPDIDAPGVDFPYTPWKQSAYDVTVEFPGGCDRDVKVLSETEAGDVFRIKPGHRLSWRTDDPEKYPLPHPLLLQLHVVCSRMVKLRAGAGWRAQDGYSEGGQTAWEEAEVGDEVGIFEMVGEEEARDSSTEVVERELELRQMERRMLWAKKMQGGQQMAARVPVV